MNNRRKKKIIIGSLCGVGILSLGSLAVTLSVLQKNTTKSLTAPSSNYDDIFNRFPITDINKDWAEWVSSEANRQIQTEIDYSFTNLISKLNNLQGQEAFNEKTFNFNHVNKDSVTNTDYYVGQKELHVSPKFNNDDSNSRTKDLNGNDSTNYRYYWFAIYDKPKNGKKYHFLRALDTPNTKLAEMANYDDGANLVCLKLNIDNPTQQIKNSFLNGGNGKITIDVWSTILNLSDDFVISNIPTIKPMGSVETSSLQNEANVTTYLIEKNQNLTLKANVNVSKNYENLVWYRWYKKDVDTSEDWSLIKDSQSDVLNGITNENDTSYYKCEAYLKYDAPTTDGTNSTISETSEIISSNETKILVVDTLNMDSNREHFGVEIENKPKENWNLGNILVGDDFTVFPKIFLGDVDLTKVNNNSQQKEIIGVSKVDFSWRKLNDEDSSNSLEDTIDFTFDRTNGNLQFENIRSEQSGNYVCDVVIDFENGGQIKRTTTPLPIETGQQGKITLRIDDGGMVKFKNGESIAIRVDATIPDYDLNQVKDNIHYKWSYSNGDDSWEEIEEFKDKKEVIIEPKESYEIANNKAKIKVEAYYEETNGQKTSILPDEGIFNFECINPKLSVSAKTSIHGVQLNKEVPLSANVSWEASQSSKKWKVKYRWIGRDKNSKLALQWDNIGNDKFDEDNSTVNLLFKDDTSSISDSEIYCALKFEGIANGDFLKNYFEKYSADGYALIGPFNLIPADINSNSITKDNVKEFINKLNNVIAASVVEGNYTSPEQEVLQGTINYSSVEELVIKYLGVPNRESIQKIDFQTNSGNFFKTYRNSNSRQSSLIIDLQNGATWSALLNQQSSDVQFSVSNGNKRLSIFNLDFPFKGFNIGKNITLLNENILDIINSKKRYEDLENILNSPEKKKDLIEEIANLNQIDAKFINFVESGIEFVRTNQLGKNNAKALDWNWN